MRVRHRRWAIDRNGAGYSKGQLGATRGSLQEYPGFTPASHVLPGLGLLRGYFEAKMVALSVMGIAELHCRTTRYP